MQKVGIFAESIDFYRQQGFLQTVGIYADAVDFGESADLCRSVHFQKFCIFCRR